MFNKLRRLINLKKVTMYGGPLDGAKITLDKDQSLYRYPIHHNDKIYYHRYLISGDYAYYGGATTIRSR